MNEEITISREWLQILLRKSNNIENSQLEQREAWIANLLGYIQSAKYLLGRNKQI